MPSLSTRNDRDLERLVRRAQDGDGLALEEASASGRIRRRREVWDRTEHGHRRPSGEPQAASRGNSTLPLRRSPMSTVFAADNVLLGGTRGERSRR